ncbi:MAG: TolC family protein [Gemmatimonadota bacterium]|nr:TolC family protein [Gemmatimonadota bacterium]MDH4347258.1 TolC family protein [Gemmatimonadota bacterium]MDH5282281.1 TolC family protein [Gemmatimonadota bacterium]
MRRLLALVLTLAAAAPAEAQRPTLLVTPPPTDLSLEQALLLAVPASEAVGIARVNVKRADGEVKRAMADLLPQLNGIAGYTHTPSSQFSTDATSDTSATSFCEQFNAVPANPLSERVDSLEQSVACLSRLNPFGAFSDLPFGRRHQYLFGLQFSQTLFSSSILKGRPRAAHAGKRLAQINLSGAEAQLQLDVTQSYYDAVLADRLAEIANMAFALSETTLVQTRLARQLGTQPEFELLRATVARDNNRATVIQREALRDLSVLRLKQLLGISFDQKLRLTTSLDEAPPRDFAVVDSLTIAPQDTAVESRNAVLQADEAVTVQRVLTEVTQWDRIPTVTLNSRYARIGYPETAGPWDGSYRTDWTIGVNVAVPLWTSGRLKGNTWVAEASLTQAELRARQAREGAALDAQDAITRLKSALARWASTQGTVEQAQRAYEIADLRYREGISTQVELSDARLLLVQAEANRATAARDTQVARARIALLKRLPLPGSEVSQTLTTAQSGQQSLQQTTATTSSNGFAP